MFTCAASPDTCLSTRMPEIIWRAGLDLSPIDVGNLDQTSWLETLVWPEQARHLDGLRGALRVAAAHQPRLVQEDLRGDALASLCPEAPQKATLVVFHTAVLVYVADHADRQAFADRATSLSHYWICNEALGVMPDITANAGEPSQTGRFLLSVNGKPVAWTDPHGAAIEWIGRPGTTE